MSDRPLVSVVTGTWQRHELLIGLIENIRAQTYRPLEHVIVSDGPDPELADTVKTFQIEEMEATIFGGQHGTRPEPSGVPIIFAELGRNWSTFVPHSFSAGPFLTAQLLARGAYQCWAADDERFDPDHIEVLVGLMEEEGTDFAYSRSRIYWNGTPVDDGYDIGDSVPSSGGITQACYRVEMLKHRMFTFGVGTGTDWDQISHWIRAGASWSFLPRVTHVHRIDH